MQEKQIIMEEKIEEKIIEVDLADLKIAQVSVRLVTRGLGSCLGITIYDPIKKIGAMAHAMLPDIDKARIKSNPARFVNSVIKKAVEELEKLGSSRVHLVAKLFGGAHMFAFIASDSILNVGQKNIEAAEATLKKLGIKVAAQEIGGAFGRTIELNLENGKVLVRTISLGEKEV